MVYAEIGAKQHRNLAEAEYIPKKSIKPCNSDIQLTRHASKMMLRRGVDSNKLVETVYSPK
ncbi:MAG: hypothetical protein QXR58_02530, partial [Candidatus Micrarchaeaceae archaeon]